MEKVKKSISAGYLLMIGFSILLTSWPAQNTEAAIADGANAIDLLGQYDGTNFVDPVPIYTKNGADDSQNRLGFDQPRDILVDTVDHRLFVSDASNRRVLVYNLNVDDTLPDRIPDFVLGQTNFVSSPGSSTTQASLNVPVGLAYDSVGKRLFVAQSAAHRVSVFDVTSITNGENAVNVLGQANFTTGASANTQAGMNNPQDLAYDAAGQRLFVSQSNHRVTVFDVTAITNGENAVNVLGQANFTANGSATTQTGMTTPQGLAYDSAGQRLFVAQTNNDRVTVYDVAGITDGEPAINVLGQADFTSSVEAVTQNGMRNPQGLAYDAAGQRLFVAQSGSANRVTVYDVAAISNGEAAINVLGQPDFTSSAAATNQSGMNFPTGLAYDQTNQRLFVAQDTSNRVAIFDVTGITDGENAVDLLGQYDGTSLIDPQPIYTKGGSDDSPNRLGMNDPYGIEIDSVNHRLFVSERDNNRVLVYNLNVDNTLVDHIPDFVLGQPDFVSSVAEVTQAGMTTPQGLVYDSAGQRLFVAQQDIHRITVFDVATITNGENAINVLGQGDFTSGISPGFTQASTINPKHLAYDPVGQRLFVVNNRVTVFDVSTITDGENATGVLGQADFITGTSATTATGMSSPIGVAYDATGQRLFVGQLGSHRVTVYDLSDGVTNGEAAVNVLGQINFTASSSANTQTGMNGTQGLAYDAVNQRLFVAQSGASRVTVYDVTAISDGEGAVNVLGQATFTAAGSTVTQAGMSQPQGLAYDPTSGRLFVVQQNNRRVSIFDAAAATPDVVGPIVNFTDDVAAGPVASDTVSVTATDDSGIADLQYKIINNAVCDAGNYGALDGISFASGNQIINQTTEAQNGNYVCVYAEDTLANSTYQGSANDFNIDDTNPVIAEVTPVPTPTNDTTPNYTFSSTEAGTISYGGDCSSATTAASSGNNSITFNALAPGAHTNCTVTVTDGVGNASNILDVNDFTIDTTSPTVDSIVRASANPTNAASVNFTVTFTENVVGVNIGDFSLNTTGTVSAIISSLGGGPMIYTVVVDTVAGDGNLRLDLIDDDSIQDSAGNSLGGAGAGNGTFITGEVYAVDNFSPTIAEVTPVPASTTDTTPDYTFSSTEAGSISYGGACSSATVAASSGNNTITFNALAVGSYSNCTITVTDAGLNASNILNVSSFTVQAPAPVAPPSGGGGAGGGFGQPAGSGSGQIGSSCTTTTCISDLPQPEVPGEPAPETPIEPEQPVEPSEPTQPEEPIQPGEPIPEFPSQPEETFTPPVQTPTPAQTIGGGAFFLGEFNSINEPDLVGEDAIFATETDIDASFVGAGIYGRGASRTERQLSLTCNYANFSSEFGISVTQNSDADGDGLSDQLECLAQTDPTEADTDGDGFSDSYEELTLGTNPRRADGQAGSDLLVITTPEDNMLTGDETPLVKGVNTSRGDVKIYIFDSKDFEDISAKIIAELEADESLGEVQKAELYDQRFTKYVQEILNKFIAETLDPENPEEAKFIDRIQLLGDAPTADNTVFLLDSEKSLIDNTYLAMAHNAENLYSEEVEFEVDSSLKVLNPDVNTLGNKPIPVEALLGELKIEIDAGNLRPVLVGNIKEPSKVVANWQSDIVSSALIADSLDENFRLSAPTDLPPGEHTVYITAYRRSDGAQSETLKIPFIVSADGELEVDEEGLPWWYIAGGAGVLIVIAGAVWLIRRKKA